MENSILVVIISLVTLISMVAIVYRFAPFKNPWRALLTVVTCYVAISILAPQTEDGSNEPRQTARAEPFAKLWVTSGRLNRRTCPSTNCGVIGQFFFREGIDVFEYRNGWVRVTDYYDASCTNGRSEYIDSGNNQCTPDNGITDAKFAEWVSAKFLSETRPPDPAAGVRGAEALIAGSDDFARYRTQFAKAAQSLIDQRRCTAGDFRENGGWVKSSTYPNRPIYFMYCGGHTIANRLYLNAKTGEVFR